MSKMLPRIPGRAPARLLVVLLGGLGLAAGGSGCLVDDDEDGALQQARPDRDGRDDRPGDDGHDDDGNDGDGDDGNDGDGDGDDGNDGNDGDGNDGDGDDGNDGDDCGDSHEDECETVFAGFGMVCTTCPGDAEPECLVAECSQWASCVTDAGEEGTELRCMDPRGRIATDCSTEWTSNDTAGMSFGGGDYLHSCDVSFGLEAGTTSSCHYPGGDTCVFDEFCVICDYQDGSGSSVCGEDLPTIEDLLAGHPEGLPAPGECVTETEQGGLVECSTCTREDMSATTLCRFAPATCDFLDEGPGLCIGCELQSGGQALICDPPLE